MSSEFDLDAEARLATEYDGEEREPSMEPAITEENDEESGVGEVVVDVPFADTEVPFPTGDDGECLPFPTEL